MSNDHIEISSGTVQSVTITDANGSHSDPSQIDQFQFFVELVEADGAYGLWSGLEYSTAILEAHEAGMDFSLPVHDCVIGGAV